MHVYKKSTFIDCSAKDLFDFHLDADNLKKITPKNIKVKMLTEEFKAKKGAIMRLKTIKYGIPTFWEVMITTLQEPNLMIDKALRSPFAYWEHQHIFQEDEEEGNRLVDVVHFKMPLGFLGEWFVPLIKKDLENMFAYRHKVTKSILEAKT